MARSIYTFHDIVSRIITTVGNNSRNITDFSQGSNVRAIIDAFAHFVEYLQLQINIAHDAFVVSKAKGDNLDNRVQDYGITRTAAVNAYGTITFTRDTAATETFTIPSGVQVSTQPDVFGNSIDYLLSEDVVFPSGGISVTGTVVCTVPGLIGNQPSGTITAITSSIPGIDSVTNAAAFTTGAEEETDEQLRKRIPDHINGLKKANQSAIEAAVLAIDGISVVRVDQNVPRTGEITVYVSSQSGVLSTEQVTAVREAVEDTVAFGITGNVATPTITYVDIVVQVNYDTTNYTSAVMDALVRDAVYDVINANATTTLKIVDITLAVMKINGVKNVKGVTIAGVADDYTGDGFNVIRVSDKYANITVTWI